MCQPGIFQIGTGGNISRGNHQSNSVISQDTSSTLFVIGFVMGTSMICWRRPSIKPIYLSFRVVYGLIIQGWLYLGISIEFPL